MKKTFEILISVLGGTLSTVMVLFWIGFVLWNFDMTFGIGLRLITLLIGLGLGVYFTKIIYQQIA